MLAEVLTSFDYAALDLETRILVQQCTGEIRSIMRRTAYDAIEIGQKLHEVKARLGHGNFTRWLRCEFEWSERTAQNYMLVYEEFATVADLDAIAPGALYLLAAPSTPEEARAEALQAASSGVAITKEIAKAIVNKHKAALVGQEITIQAGEYQGQTARVVTPGDLFVECEMHSGEAVSLLTSEIVAPNHDSTRLSEPKPNQLSEIVARLEATQRVDRARIALLEDLLQQTIGYLPEELQSRIAAIF